MTDLRVKCALQWYNKAMKITCPQCKNSKSPTHFKGRALCGVCYLRYKKSKDYPQVLAAVESEVIPVGRKIIQVDREPLRKREKSQVDTSPLRKWQHSNHVRLRNMREFTLNLKYGISIEDYNLMMESQEGKCLICGESDSALVVDHCHTTGQVRGLLCSLCNSGLGFFKDNTDNMAKAIEYLESSRLPS